MNIERRKLIEWQMMVGFSPECLVNSGDSFKERRRRQRFEEDDVAALHVVWDFFCGDTAYETQ